MSMKDYFLNIISFICKGFTTNSVRDFYNNSAMFYEKAMPMQDKLVSRIVSFMPECDTALDIAMGTGITSYHMSKKCKRLLSIDFSDSMIGEARKKSLDACILKGDFLNLPLLDNSVDVAVCTGAIRHVPEDSYGHFFKEISRVSGQFITEAREFTILETIYLKAYGRFMRMLGHYEQPLNSDKRNLSRAMADAGFDVEFVPFDKSNRNYVAVGTR